MPTICSSCGEDYSNDLEACPGCNTPNHRYERTRKQGQKRSHAEMSSVLTKSGSATRTAINGVRRSIAKPLIKYTMTTTSTVDPKRAKSAPEKGKSNQSAITVVKFRGSRGKVTTESYTTTLQQHSEMVALEAGLDSERFRLVDGQVRLPDRTPVPASAFQTELPHCGFCTIILQAAGLPLSKPTAGNGTMACNFNYPLPERLRTSAAFYARLLGESTGADGWGALKKLLNAFIGGGVWVLQAEGRSVADPEASAGDGFIIRWEEVVARDHGELLKQLWAHICQAIYETNKTAGRNIKK
jgi:hypothetical protein